jgi:lipopolysaccharide transport system permease protein
MIKREVVGRYRGSILGLFWSFAHPLLMLSVYTFAFSVVFKARWGEMEETKAQFATIAFVGMIVHGLLADVVTRAPALILSHVNFVKKVVFPLEILPIVLLGSALFHYAVNLSVLLLALLVTSGGWHWTIILIPFVLLPFSIMASGIAWALASLGVYIRDIGQIASILMTVAMFLSPVFYPLSAIPEKYHYIILASPLTFIIEQARAVLVFGRLPHWKGLLVYYIVASGVAWLGFAWFQKTRKGFADVL